MSATLGQLEWELLPTDFRSPARLRPHWLEAWVGYEPLKRCDVAGCHWWEHWRAHPERRRAGKP